MLKIQFKDGRADPVPLAAPGQTVGKTPVNDIVIDEEGVNGFHADLKVEGDRVILSDVNTDTGTWLNGEKLTGPVDLNAGDVITIQGVELEVVEAADEESKTLVLSGTALLEMGAGGWALVADSGPEKGQIIPVKDKITIGRALECDLSILEPGLSRHHAELSLVDDELVLTDLNSSNGTFVNGEKIQEQHLKEGDVMQFDKVRFVVTAP